MRGTDIAERLALTGRTKSALGRHLGRDAHYAGRLVKNPKELTPSVADRIEAFFAAPEAVEPPMIRVPVFGYAAAGDDERISLASDQVLDELELPAALLRGEAMAVRVAGDSMEPRLYSGEIVIVAKGVAPARFGDCIVEMRDGTALVKQYRGQRDGNVFVYQYNPEREYPIEGSKVRALHAVVYRR